jgi:hypothetical protein
LRPPRKFRQGDSGSSGGTSGSTGNKSGDLDLSAESRSGTTLARAGVAIRVTKAAGETIRCTAAGTYSVPALGGADISAAGTGKFRYSPAGANSWTDFAATVIGSAANYYSADLSSDPGILSISQSAAPADGDYDVELVLGVSNSGAIFGFDGSASIRVGA